MSNSDFDKNGLDSYGIHWLQYAAFAVSGFAIFTTWGFFFDERFHNFIINIFRINYNPILLIHHQKVTGTFRTKLFDR